MSPEELEKRLVDVPFVPSMFDSGVQRFNSDPEFHALVMWMVKTALEAGFTGLDLKTAAYVAELRIQTLALREFRR